MSNRSGCKALILKDKSAFFGCSKSLKTNETFFIFFQKKCPNFFNDFNDLAGDAPMGLGV
tara:strand:+ start:332 stop:511 length:180 start_codon:yes stop_codon:yes gene_type:complete